MPIEIHDETSAEALAETRTKTQPTQFLRETPYPERFALQKAVEQSSFNILGELKNFYVNIPLLQALHDVPIYTKTIRDLVVKKPGRKPEDPTTVHVVGKLFELMMGRAPVAKYDEPSNPTVTGYIGHTQIPNVLVDLGTSINVMTIETVKKIGTR